jgi:excinuclease ABC subunit B
LQGAIWQIQQDLVKQVDYFKEIGKHLEAKRLEERTNFDLEMIRELGTALELSRYLDGRLPGTRPFCLLDYFPKFPTGGGRKPRNTFSSERHVW